MGIKRSSASALYRLQESYDFVRRKFLYNNLIDFGVHMKLVRLIKICLNATYSRVRVGMDLSDMSPIRNGIKQGDILLSLLNDQYIFLL